MASDAMESDCHSEKSSSGHLETHQRAWFCKWVRDIYEMIGDPPTAKSALKGILCIAKRRSETPEGFPFLNKYRIECVTQNGEILCEEREKDILLLCAQLKNLFDSLEKHWDDKVLRYVDMLLVLFREHQRRQRHAGSVFPYWNFYKYGPPENAHWARSFILMSAKYPVAELPQSSRKIIEDVENKALEDAKLREGILPISDFTTVTDRTYYLLTRENAEKNETGENTKQSPSVRFSTRSKLMELFHRQFQLEEDKLVEIFQEPIGGLGPEGNWKDKRHEKLNLNLTITPAHMYEQANVPKLVEHAPIMNIEKRIPPAEGSLELLFRLIKDWKMTVKELTDDEDDTGEDEKKSVKRDAGRASMPRQRGRVKAHIKTKKERESKPRERLTSKTTSKRKVIKKEPKNENEDKKMEDATEGISEDLKALIMSMDSPRLGSEAADVIMDVDEAFTLPLALENPPGEKSTNAIPTPRRSIKIADLLNPDEDMGTSDFLIGDNVNATKNLNENSHLIDEVDNTFSPANHQGIYNPTLSTTAQKDAVVQDAIPVSALHESNSHGTYNSTSIMGANMHEQRYRQQRELHMGVERSSHEQRGQWTDPMRPRVWNTPNAAVLSPIQPALGSPYYGNDAAYEHGKNVPGPVMHPNENHRHYYETNSGHMMPGPVMHPKENHRHYYETNSDHMMPWNQRRYYETNNAAAAMMRPVQHACCHSCDGAPELMRSQPHPPQFQPPLPMQMPNPVYQQGDNVQSQRLGYFESQDQFNVEQNQVIPQKRRAASPEQYLDRHKSNRDRHRHVLISPRNPTHDDGYHNRYPLDYSYNGGPSAREQTENTSHGSNYVYHDTHETMGASQSGDVNHHSGSQQLPQPYMERNDGRNTPDSCNRSVPPGPQ